MTQVQVPLQRVNGHRSLRTLIVGAGEAGNALARDLLNVRSFGLQPAGFVDDDPESKDQPALPVLGALDDIHEVVVDFDIDVVVIAIPSLPAERFREVAVAAASGGAAVRYLPSFYAALQRDVVGSDLRTLDVRALIGRHEVHVASPAARAVIAGRRVLVTGAGGSIGSELCRQVQGFGPSRLYMLDHDESNLHRLQLEIYGEALLDDDGLIVADIRDRARIHQVFAEL